MTASKPRVAYDNILFKNRTRVWATSEESGFLAQAVADWKYGTRWKPKFTNNTLLSNHDFLTWSSGTISAPDNWTHAGSGGISQGADSTVTPPYAANLIGDLSGTNELYQDYSSYADFAQKKVSFGAVANTATVSLARIGINDGVTTTWSSYHTGGSSDEWLTVTHTMAAGATRLRVYCQVAAGLIVSALFKSVSLVEGASVEQLPAEPEDSYLYVYPYDDSEELELPNSTFISWTNGPLEPPDGWEESGTNHVYLESGGTAGRYRLEVQGNSGADRYGYYEITDATTLNKLKGKYVSFGAMAECSLANKAYIKVEIKARDDSTYIELGTDTHTAAGSEEWLKTSACYIPFNATAVRLSVHAFLSTANCQFDRVRAVYGGSTVEATEAPDSSSSTVFCVADHNLYSAGLSIALEGSDNGSSWTSIVAVTPTSDKAIWRDFGSVSYKMYRVKVYKASHTPGSGKGAVQAVIGVIFIGTYFEFPWYSEILDPNSMKVDHEIAKGRYGTPMGSSVRQTSIKRRLEFPNVSNTFVTGTWENFKLHAGLNTTKECGLPFFVQYDDGDNEDTTWFAWIAKNHQFSEPRGAGLNCPKLSFEFEVIQE